MAKPLDNLVGQTFGRLQILGLSGMSPDGRRRMWACLCVCGNHTSAATAQLKNGRKKSCGCLLREMARSLCLSRVTHGQTKSKTYRAWVAMRSRCGSLEHYKSVGICPEWVSFAQFLLDMGPAPAGLSIERRNSREGYSPGNCMWGTDLQQQNNKGSNIWLLPDGSEVDYSRKDEARTLAEIVRERGQDYQLVYVRFRQRGWNLEDALNTPKRARSLETQPRKKRKL